MTKTELEIETKRVTETDTETVIETKRETETETVTETKRVTYRVFHAFWCFLKRHISASSKFF